MNIEFDKYFLDIYNGKITACNKMRRQAENLLKAREYPDTRKWESLLKWNFFKRQDCRLYSALLMITIYGSIMNV